MAAAQSSNRIEHEWTDRSEIGIYSSQSSGCRFCRSARIMEIQQCSRLRLDSKRLHRFGFHLISRKCPLAYRNVQSMVNATNYFLTQADACNIVCPSGRLNKLALFRGTSLRYFGSYWFRIYWRTKSRGKVLSWRPCYWRLPSLVQCRCWAVIFCQYKSHSPGTLETLCFQATLEQACAISGSFLDLFQTE